MRKIKKPTIKIPIYPIRKPSPGRPFPPTPIKKPFPPPPVRRTRPGFPSPKYGTIKKSSRLRDKLKSLKGKK